MGDKEGSKGNDDALDDPCNGESPFEDFPLHLQQGQRKRILAIPGQHCPVDVEWAQRCANMHCVDPGENDDGKPDHAEASMRMGD
eukprot:2384942-Pyramimonas_sp.AAC.1